MTTKTESSLKLTDEELAVLISVAFCALRPEDPHLSTRQRTKILPGVYVKLQGMREARL